VSHPVNRRRSRLIDRQFQVGLAWRMIIVYFLFSLAGIVIAFAPSMYVIATTTDLNVLEPAAREFLVLHHRIWPAAAILFGGLFAYTLVFSHRIAGPIYRIDSVLRGMLEGVYPEKITLRRKDYFQPTAELLERLSRQLAGSGGSRKNPPSEGPGPRPDAP